MFFVVAVLCTLVSLGFLALGSMDQRALRGWFAARQGRDPAGNAPSAAGYAAGRVAWWVLAGLFAVGAYQTWSSATYFSLGEGEAQEIVDDAVADLESGPRLPTLADGFESYVSDAVREASKDTAALPRVSLDGEGAGEGGGVERYDVSLGEGEYRYCLVVTSTESEEGGMTVPGAVQGQESTHFSAYDLAVEAENGGC